MTKNYCIRLILVSYKKPKNMARLMYTTKCCSFAIYITKQASSEGTKHSFEKWYSLLSLSLPTFLLQIKFVKSWSSILNSYISDSWCVWLVLFKININVTRFFYELKKKNFTETSRSSYTSRWSIDIQKSEF